MGLGPNKVRNPDCLHNGGEWGSGSLGTEDGITGSGDFNMGNQQNVLDGPGSVKLILVYEADGPFRAVVGNITHTVPAHVGVYEGDFSVTSGDGIAFVDPEEAITYRILHVEVRDNL